MAHLERVSKAVEEAKATGHIKSDHGGEKRKGNGDHDAPTLLAGALQDDAIVQEVFGRVVSVMPFDNEEQVVNWWTTASTDLHFAGMDERCGRAHRRVSARLQYGCTRSIPISCW
ncbi:aldehyde dehydrogenase family protein [Escherichia coli]